MQTWKNVSPLAFQLTERAGESVRKKRNCMNQNKTVGPVSRNPRLSPRNLTILLLLLAAVPSIATVGMFYMVPGTQEGQLPVRFAIQGLPGPEHYQKPAKDRQLIIRPMFVVKNISDQPWRNLYIELNGRFEKRDMKAVVQPGEIVSYDLHVFYEKRTSVRFAPEHQPVESVRIFAKVGKSSRESFTTKVRWEDYGKEITNKPASKE